MEKARKIKATDQKKLDHAKKRGLNLDNLINLYGLKFVLKLLTSLIKPQLTGPNTTFPVYPR